MEMIYLKSGMDEQKCETRPLRMPARKKIDLGKVKASLATPCPHCGYQIPPAELRRISTTQVRCPKCKTTFTASASQSPRTRMYGFFTHGTVPPSGFATSICYLPRSAVRSPDRHFHGNGGAFPTLQELQRVGKVKVRQFPSTEAQLLSAFLTDLRRSHRCSSLRTHLADCRARPRRGARRMTEC